MISAIYSLVYLLLALIPVIIYLCVVYVTVPYRTITISQLGRYFLYGFFSVATVLGFQIFFPWWNSMFMDDTVFGLLWKSFLQIALLEEIAKYISFKISETANLIGDVDIHHEQANDNPISTMVYCGVAALGLAFLENVKYAMDYGLDILWIRSSLSMMLHFICGLIMGYWISLGKMDKKDIGKHSIFDYLVLIYPNFKRTTYLVIGILCATFIHGLFDYSIFLLGQYSIISCLIELMVAALIAYICFNDLYSKMPNKRPIKDKVSNSNFLNS